MGLATALHLMERFPAHKTVVLEKEQQVALHQTGHNSGVIHSGIYYKPGSRKAKSCVDGAQALVRFCQENGIPYQMCGKVVVAIREAELPVLEELYRRGTNNGVPGLEMIGADRLKELEPNAVGLKALYSPASGIVDYRQVAQAYARKFQVQGGEVKLGAEVLHIRQGDAGIIVETYAGDFECRHLINCAGLYSDRIARMMGVQIDVTIVPFRGEYYLLKSDSCHLVRGLLYPVPDPALPFLGVHFSRTIEGVVEAGPNAVLAFAREGYHLRDIHLGEMLHMLTFAGFWRMSGRYWKTGVKELYRSVSKKAFTRSLQRLVPAIQEEDLVRGGAGVRAQAVDGHGNLVDDFRIAEAKNAIHVLNAPSPGATASLAIARDIVLMAEKTFELR